MKNILVLEYQLTQTQITFCYGHKTYKKVLKSMYKLPKETIQCDGTCTSIENKVGKVEYVIGIKKFENIYELKALLVHEISHCVSQIMSDFGLEDDEVRSYSLQWLYSNIIPYLDNLIKKAK